MISFATSWARPFEWSFLKVKSRISFPLTSIFWKEPFNILLPKRLLRNTPSLSASKSSKSNEEEQGKCWIAFEFYLNFIWILFLIFISSSSFWRDLLIFFYFFFFFSKNSMEWNELKRISIIRIMEDINQIWFQWSWFIVSFPFFYFFKFIYFYFK